MSQRILNQMNADAGPYVEPLPEPMINIIIETGMSIFWVFSTVVGILGLLFGAYMVSVLIRDLLSEGRLLPGLVYFAIFIALFVAFDRAGFYWVL